LRETPIVELMSKVDGPSDRLDEIGAATRALVEAYLGGYPEFDWPGDFFRRIQIFATELARWGARFNLTAAPDNPAELAFHILDSLMPLVLRVHESDGPLAQSFAPDKRILDLGSGAGFPGLILAAASEGKFLMVESRRKRASFLTTIIGAMGLGNVEVDSQYRRLFAPEFDMVTARAFARPTEFYEVAITALKPDGIAMLYASDRQREEIQASLHKWGHIPKFYSYEPPRVGYRSIQAGTDSPRHLIVMSRRGESTGDPT
jgi:16S rRNA (guanine527-N7)-methyltransferase